MACSSDTSVGTFWIWLRDRSSRSRCLRVPSPEGNSENWFPDRLRVRRALSWPRVGGSCWIRFPFRLSVSSFFSLEISLGMQAEDRESTNNWTLLNDQTGSDRTETPKPDLWRISFSKELPLWKIVEMIQSQSSRPVLLLDFVSIPPLSLFPLQLFCLIETKENRLQSADTNTHWVCWSWASDSWAAGSFRLRQEEPRSCSLTDPPSADYWWGAAAPLETETQTGSLSIWCLNQCWQSVLRNNALMDRVQLQVSVWNTSESTTCQNMFLCLSLNCSSAHDTTTGPAGFWWHTATH